MGYRAAYLALRGALHAACRLVSFRDEMKSKP
jgi:hypothetical protein